MKKFDQINVIPMIDVMLVLLAIVLTTASFIVQDQLNITLPETEKTRPLPADQVEKSVQIAINAQGQLYFNQQPIALTQLKLLLHPLRRQQAILLKVDRQARFGIFAKVIDQLKARGFENLTIVTQHTS